MTTWRFLNYHELARQIVCLLERRHNTVRPSQYLSGGWKWLLIFIYIPFALGNSVSSNPRRLTTSALLNKHLQGGHDFGAEILPKYDKLNLRTEFPNASSSFAQEQFIRKYNNQPLFLDRNVDIEISDDEDVTYVPPMSKSNNFNNFSLGGPSTNGESRKSPTSTQKPIPGLIPRSSVTKLKPIERFSRYSQPAERSSRFSSQREPSSLLTRASIYSGLNNFRMSTLRKASAISKENVRLFPMILKFSCDSSENPYFNFTFGLLTFNR